MAELSYCVGQMRARGLVESQKPHSDDLPLVKNYPKCFTLAGHAELEAPHYEALKDKGYGQEMRRLWAEPYFETSFCQDSRPEKLIQQVVRHPEPVYLIMGEVADLSKELHRHIDASKKKEDKPKDFQGIKE